MRRLVMGIVGLLTAAGWASPENGWVKYPGNPVMGSPELGTCFDLNVVPWGSAKYNNYFSWRPQKCIALARSADGVNWSEPVKCLEADPTSGWEDDLNRATVWFKDGVYHMWYCGQARGYTKIGYATSTDGVRFTRVSRRPVMISEFPHEGFSVMNPYVRWDESRQVWRMWYASGETYEPNVLCYAESRDGLAWEKSPLNPIFIKGKGWEKDRVGGCEVHPLPDGRWIMFYIGYSDINTARIGAAVSADGVTGWTRLKGNPLVEPTPGEWDSAACYKPSVVREKDRWLLWYNGRTSSREYIGMAEHKGLDLGPLDVPYNRVLSHELARRRFDRFNCDDVDLYRNAIGNGRALSTIGQEIPLFECPDEEIERTYYFRWWTYRKHLRKTEKGWVVTEFLPDVSWAGKYNTISCPMGHHLREGRWLRNQDYLDDYTRIMLDEGTLTGPRAYANGPAWASLERAKVTGNGAFAKAHLAEFVRNYEAWEKGWTAKGLSLRDTGSARSYAGPEVATGFRTARGLFDFVGNREGSEFALSLDGARPMVNAMMWAEAEAIATIAGASGDAALAARFAEKAETLAGNIRTKLWNPEVGFFTTLGCDGTSDTVRELHGYAPFYFGLPLDGTYGASFKALVEPTGFLGPKGLTYPAQDTPGFAKEPDLAAHECLWNGPSWPYATSVALTALASELQKGKDLPVTSKDFARLLHQYAAQHVRVREDGRRVAWIDENLDAFTGEWIARKVLLEKARAKGVEPKIRERGKDYNHSTFCDLVISGLCGFVPQTDGSFVVKPLAPAAWDWWCVDGIRYHGKDVTVLFDRDGTRYGKGKGLVVLADGKVCAPEPEKHFRGLRAEAARPRECVAGFLWLEAENFEMYGDWEVDTQFTHKMGSAYLICPGLGTPRARPARTTVAVPRAGTWYVWARTKDWVPEHSPGKFVLTVDGHRSPTLGASGRAGWLWEKAGAFELPAGNVAVELADLSGAFARCDALIFTECANYVPPEDDHRLEQERRRLAGLSEEAEEKGEFDFVVVGAGAGGIGAAVSAARMGARVALIYDRPVPGGNGSREMGIGLDGAQMSKKGSREAGLAEEFRMRAARLDSLGLAYEEVLREMEGRIVSFPNERVLKVEKEGRRIVAVTSRSTLTGRWSRYRGKLFADATGDGWVAKFAGARLMYGREDREAFGESWTVEKADTLTMSGTIMGGCMGMRVTRVPPGTVREPYQAPAWAKVLPRPFWRPQQQPGSDWWMENPGRIDDIEDPEGARDNLIRIAFDYWDWQCNEWEKKELTKDYRLDYVPYHNARREGMRVVGDYILTGNDCRSERVFPDAVSTGGWSCDVHDPLGMENPRSNGWNLDHRGGPGPYTVPYRMLYAADVDNLFLASRCFSMTHIALGSMRVGGTIMSAAQAVGTAAAFCLRRNLLPREYGARHLDELRNRLFRDDLNIQWLADTNPDNLALKAKASAAGLNDGIAVPEWKDKTTVADYHGWASEDRVAELTWDSPVELTEIGIVFDTGLKTRRVKLPMPEELVRDYAVEVRSDGTWHRVATETDNRLRYRVHRFPKLTGDAIRVVVERTWGDRLSRILEIRAYGND